MALEWQAWRKMITLALLVGRNGQLALPLGKWRKGKEAKDGFFLVPGQSTCTNNANEDDIFTPAYPVNGEP